MSLESFEREAWDRQIRHLVRQTGMPLLLFAEAAGQRTQEVLDWWSGAGEPLNQANLYSLSQYLGVRIEDLKTGTCDTKLVRGRIYEGPSALPEEFGRNASSYARTSAHIMEYLSLMYGRSFVDRILLNMNIHPLFFDNLDHRINLQFFITFLNELSRQGISDDEIASLACFMFLRLRNTKIGEEFAAATSYEQCYTVLMKDVQMFESNFEYSIDCDREKLRIVAKPAEAEEFLRHLDPKDYQRLFAYRQKAFGWFPLLSGLSPLNLQVKKCIARGDSETVYEADLHPELASGAFRDHLKIVPFTPLS